MATNSFDLTRTFSRRSLVGILMVAVLMTWFHRWLAVDAMTQNEAQNNVQLTQVLSNTIWPRYASFITTASSLPYETLSQQGEIASLRRELAEKIVGLHILKIKIYNTDGLTVFSTDPKQIGQSKLDNPGFRAALSGQVASEITFKNQIDTFEGVRADRNIIFSYIPIYPYPNSQVAGIFEVYADVTHLLGKIRQTSYIVALGVTFLLVILYLFLLAVVRQADGIIRTHKIEERQTQNQVMQHLARHDSLTDLPNRTHMLERLDQALERARRTNTRLALLYFNVTRFRIINDSLGHEAGDMVLMEATLRLTDCIRGGDTLGRLGGDEFLVIVENISSVDQVATLAQRHLAAFLEPIEVNDRQLVLTPSIGIALFPEDADRAEKLIEDAGAAALKAKDQGRNRFVFYTESLNASSLERLEMETAIHNALSNGEFLLNYQPRISISAQKVIGCEALLRWQHPQKGQLSPDHFISLLEETDLIIPVGEWIIREACRQCREWQLEGLAGLRVSVNLSLRQCQSETLLETVGQALADTGLAASCLELEITESVMADEMQHTLTLLKQLKKKGILLSIDDFGTGYSSLSHLMHFPVDHLKVDRAFVQDITRNSNHAALTDAIIAMAKSLKMGVVAEGIEEEDQLHLLEEKKCDELQGYFFAKPLPPERFLLEAKQISQQLQNLSAETRNSTESIVMT
ncbi:MAG: EAL domain-containing protein [Magnetococcales bacterium]|nr:EAL domain-containing protein [Magnetococcales bacterium]